MSKAVVRYKDKGVFKSVYFNKDKFDRKKVSEILNNEGIKNFMFYFEPDKPVDLDANTVLFSGEVGYEITTNTLLDYLKEGKTLAFDSFGGYLDEGWKIHDLIKNYYPDTQIEILGASYSSMMQILLAAKPENRFITENSTGLIHAPWTYEIGDDETFQKVANTLRSEKEKLADFYVKESGKTLDLIIQTMKDEKILSSAEMVEFNFANLKIKENINHNNNSEQMAEEKKLNKEQAKSKNALLDLGKTILNAFGGSKNIVLQTVTGENLDFGEEITSQDQIVVGTTATIEDAPVEGEYVIKDTTFTFEGGAVVSIKEGEGDGENEEMAVLTAENNSLKEKNKTLENSLSEKEVELKNANEKFEKLKGDFSNYKEKADTFINSFSEEKKNDGGSPAKENKNKNVRRSTKKK